MTKLKHGSDKATSSVNMPRTLRTLAGKALDKRNQTALVKLTMNDFYLQCVRQLVIDELGADALKQEKLQ